MTVVEKESIPNLHFPVNGIERSVENESKKIIEKLTNATILGNIYHIKARIQFVDDEGEKEVQTTVWAVGERFISLKSGTLIPINRVLDVII